MERLTEDAILALADRAQDTVFLVDRGGIVRYVSARCADTLGFALCLRGLDAPFE
ncbi:hypothetical protein D9X30_1320 [Cupriavidus sp. U2]|uniref:hypothetical protein n=1 Tax=Cupriavidus sp. U2 TaxID=2920269 RepID=UPI00129D6EFF|nr:hypothetical protein [Cupriavidus sp. U2]KAI3593593.1 hypothetical protein D9X30_1320 [Cupriavidus sp. U2]